MKNYNSVAAIVLTVMGGSSAFGAGAILDTFDTFTSTYAGQSGFYLTRNTSGTSSDTSEVLLTPSDTDFASLSRKVDLILNSGTALSTLANGNISPTIQPLGYLLWGNQGSDTTAKLTYTFSTAVDLTLLSQIDFNFLANDLGASVNVNILSSSLSEGSLIGTANVPGVLSATTASIPFSLFAGNQSVLDSVKRITITFDTINPNLDLNLDSITFSNPNVPEASTAVPVLAVTSALGLAAWRRRQRKA